MGPYACKFGGKKGGIIRSDPNTKNISARNLFVHSNVEQIIWGRMHVNSAGREGGPLC